MELVEMAETAAMAELEAFGCIEFEDGTTQAEFDEENCEPFWEFACDLAGEPSGYRFVLTDLF